MHIWRKWLMYGLRRHYLFPSHVEFPSLNGTLKLLRDFAMATEKPTKPHWTIGLNSCLSHSVPVLLCRQSTLQKYRWNERLSVTCLYPGQNIECGNLTLFFLLGMEKKCNQTSAALQHTFYNKESLRKDAKPENNGLIGCRRKNDRAARAARTLT